MEPSNLPQLYLWFDKIYSEIREKPLHVFLVFPQIDFKKLAHISEVENIKFEYTQIDKQFYKIRLGLRTREAEGWLSDLKDYWIIYITSTESSTMAGEVAKTWIKKLFPSISMARIRSDHLLDILASIDELEDTHLMINDYIMRRSGIKDKRYTSKSWEAGEKFDRKYVENNTMVQKRVIDAVHFSLQNQNEIFKVKISRSGHFVYYSGGMNGFSEFHRLVVSRALERAKNYWENMSNREAKIENDKYEIRPIIYNSTTRIELKPMLSKIRQAFIKGNLYNVSVEHHGNPWLLMHIIDRGDGSIYDIHGFSNQIKVVPSFRATSQSITKLDNMLRDVLPEVKIEN